MAARHRHVFAGGALVAAACVLGACGNSPSPPEAATTSTSSTTTTTTTTALPPTTLVLQVAVPDVVGMKIDPARFFLKVAGFVTVPLNAPCNTGTPPSQSVVASLAVPGRPPDVTVGTQPLAPGTFLPKGARVGVTWTGCYPGGTQVPAVVGHTFASAVRLLHLAGLDWACYSVGGPTTTTTTAKITKTTTTTAPTPPLVLSQGTKAGGVVQAGAVVALHMYRCPQ